MTDAQKSARSKTERPPLPKPMQWILRLTGILAILLFLTPAAYVLKYCVWDAPRENRIALTWRTAQKDPALLQKLSSDDPDNIALANQTAQKHPNAQWRLAAARSLGKILAVEGVAYRRPLEVMTAKATLGQVAVHDTDEHVRAVASDILGAIAQRGAVLRR